MAKRRVPRMFYEYVDSGSWTESTYRRNEAKLHAITFRQRVGVPMSKRSTRTSLLGFDATMPVALAPTGLTGMMHADGEILAARAAERFGVPFTLPTMSICSIEDIAAHTSRPFWFQIYMMRDLRFMERLIGRARDAGCSALVVTMDSPVLGQKHKDIKNGLSTPPRPTLANIINLMTKPRWCAGMLRTNRRSFGNIIGHVDNVVNTSSFATWAAEQYDPDLSWDHVRWLRERWDRKLIVKGILDPDDAKSAVEAGADAIVVSNHGGRQLDGTQASIEALPTVVAAVGDRVQVFLDSGIRSGQDVLKALGLGAQGVLIGRAFLYGVGAFGETGVTQALKILHRELEFTMALCGIKTIGAADDTILTHDSRYTS